MKAAANLAAAQAINPAIARVAQADGTWIVYEPEDTLPPGIFGPAPTLASIKVAKIADINAECTRRITAVWPVEKQLSALAGIYGAAQAAAMTDWIDLHIAASNVACSAVFDVPAGANAISQVEAVTVAWPV